jgi:aspartate kinase
MPALIVQKYGGSSLADAERIGHVAGRIARERAAGHDLVVVVSAMGDTTDQLIELASQITDEPDPRELDLLLATGEHMSGTLVAMALHALGLPAISLTGAQAGIRTDATHGRARIANVDPLRVHQELERGRVVIVAGFQGATDESILTGEVTTLGRGGSDTTAVALAAALGAERCDIYTDVDGVYTADPRRVPAARRLRRIDYREMQELATSGAKVVHPRAVEIAARFGIPLRVLSSLAEGEEPGGTWVVKKEPGIEELAVTGIASECCHARLILRGLPMGMEPTARVLGDLAAAGVSVDMVAQADRLDGRRQLQLTVHEDVLPEARQVCERLAAELDVEQIDVRDGLARVVLVGTGMHGRPGVYARAFDTLLRAGIDVHSLSTSSVSISLLVDAAEEEHALRVLHEAFELEVERP